MSEQSSESMMAIGTILVECRSISEQYSDVHLQEVKDFIEYENIRQTLEELVTETDEKKLRSTSSLVAKMFSKAAELLLKTETKLNTTLDNDALIIEDIVVRSAVLTLYVRVQNLRKVCLLQAVVYYRQNDDHYSHALCERDLARLHDPSTGSSDCSRFYEMAISELLLARHIAPSSPECWDDGDCDDSVDNGLRSGHVKSDSDSESESELQCDGFNPTITL